MVSAVATPAIPTSGPRIIIWSAVCSLAIHALVGWWGLRLIPAGPGALAGFGATRDAGPMVWLSDREPAPQPPPKKDPAPELKPSIPPPPPVPEPQAAEVPRKFTLGEDQGDPTKETLISSDRELEHAARQSKVEQPALSPEAGGGGGGGGGGGAGTPATATPATAAPPQPTAAAPTIPAAPSLPTQTPPSQPDQQPTDKPAPPAPAPAPQQTTQQDKREQQDRVHPTPETRAATAPGSGTLAKPEPAAKPPSEPPPPLTSEPKTAGEPADRNQEQKEEKKEQTAQDEQTAQEGAEEKPESTPDPLSTQPSTGTAPEVTEPFDPSAFVGPPAPTLEAAATDPPTAPSNTAPSAAAPPAPSAPPTPSPAPATPAPGAPGVPGLPGTTGDAKLDDAAWLSEKVSDPTSLRRAATFQNGKVTAGKGLELVVTRRPESTTYTRLLGAARNPTFDIQFDRSGEVREVIIVRSSGNRALDEDIRNAMHFWRARGSDLASLSPRPESMLTVRLTVLLFGE